METLPALPHKTPFFSKDLIELANTVHFKNTNYLQYFAILLDDIIIIIIYLHQTQQRSIITRKNKNTQTNLSGTTQSINMRANLAKM